jgi:hypothetical protein
MNGAMRASALAFALAAIPAPMPAQRELVWHTDIDAARRAAAEQHKPLLLLFRCER